jgi:membrane protease YdiL (CAAX protease family)
VTALRPAPATIPTLLLALAGPPLLVLASHRIFGPVPPIATELWLQVLFCAIPAAVILVVLYLERLPLTSIGLRRPDRWTIVSGLLLALGVLVLLPLVTDPLVTRLHGGRVDAGMHRIAGWPAWFRLFVAVTSGFAEETLYRGYAIERLAMLTGRRWLGGVLAALAFAAAHIPAWGLGFSLAADLPFSVVMTLFYLWRRDLLANGLAHSAGLVVMIGWP